MTNSPQSYKAEAAVCRMPGTYRRENSLLILEHVQEAQGSLRGFSRNKGAGRCHFPPLPMQRKHMATCENHRGSEIHYPACSHQTLPCFLGATLSSLTCLSPGTVGPLSQKTGVNFANTASPTWHDLQSLSPSSGSSRSHFTS